MRYLIVSEILDLYGQVMQQTGGSVGLRAAASLESAVAKPRQTFGGKELYPTLAEKAGAHGHSLVQNHAFLDGNKRIALKGVAINKPNQSITRIAERALRVHDLDLMRRFYEQVIGLRALREVKDNNGTIIFYAVGAGMITWRFSKKNG